MIKWAPVWTDDEMLQIVINSNVTALGKLREELNQGSLSVKLPFLEYSTGKPMAKEALPFSKANDLVKVMEIRHVEDIMKEIKDAVFIPLKVSDIEPTYFDYLKGVGGLI